MLSVLTIPDPVRRRASDAGPAGAIWLAGLADTLADLSRAWNLTIDRMLPGGTEALVVAARLADGRAAVLKLLLPWTELQAGEAQVLLAARSRGYAEVYAWDMPRAALLLERLGAPLADLRLPLEQQLALICATLSEAWMPPPDAIPFLTGAEKARSLIAFIDATWHALGQPCTHQVIDLAHQYAVVREAAFDPRVAVLAHGDAHAWNTLLVADDPRRGCKFIDPDGLIVERAYDLAIPMREWSAELLAGDPVRLGRARCQRLADLTGVAPEPIWQWGLLERVSTGLLCLQLGMDEGHTMLAVAEQWAHAEG